MLAQKKLSEIAWKLYRDVETKLLHLEPQGLFQKDMASALTELKRGEDVKVQRSTYLHG